MKLVPVSKEKSAPNILFQLLSERTPTESISHKAMPSWSSHLKFIKSNPYQSWYLLQTSSGTYVGSCYITRNREIGIGIFKEHQRKGYAKKAINMLVDLWPGKFYANINPANEKSHELFKSLGFSLIQMTYLRSAE